MIIEPGVRDFGAAGLPFDIQALHFGGTQSKTGQNSTEVLRQWHHSARAFSNTLIVVQSLPYKAYCLDPFLIAKDIGFRGKRVIGMGANCTTVLDAFELAGHYAAFGESTSIICADRFGDVARKSEGLRKSNLQDWHNAVALVQVAPGRNQTSIMRVASIAAPDLYDMLSVVAAGGGDHMQRSMEKTEKFRKIDLCNELDVIRSVLGPKTASSCLFVLTNRSTIRTISLASALGLSRKQIFSSRDVIGHTGGGDIIHNLGNAMRASNSEKKHIVISANGLGYQWSAALIQI